MGCGERRRLSIALIAGAAVVIFAVLTAGLIAPTLFVLARNLLGIGGLLPGETAPDFALRDAAGQPVRLADLRGKTVVVRFWSPDCAACRSELDSVRATAERYAADPSAAFVSVVSRIPAATVAPFVAERGIRYPVALDDTGLVADAYLVQALPTTYVITPEGRILRGFVGAGNAFQVFREAQACRASGVVTACTVQSEGIPGR